LPFVFIISFFFMSMISIPHVGMGGGNQLFLITLYYWSTYRPTLLPLWLVLIMGIIMDALIGSPLGLNALLLGMVRLWTTDQRRFLMAQSFFVNWIIFSLMAILYYLAQWATHSLFVLKILSVNGSVFFILGSIMIFPFVTVLLHMTHRILPVVGTQGVLEKI